MVQAVADEIEAGLSLFGQGLGDAHFAERLVRPGLLGLAEVPGQFRLRRGLFEEQFAAVEAGEFLALFDGIAGTNQHPLDITVEGRGKVAYLIPPEHEIALDPIIHSDQKKSCDQEADRNSDNLRPSILKAHHPPAELAGRG